jgi:hypothetical protein
MYAHKLKVVRYFHSTFTSRIRAREEKCVFSDKASAHERSPPHNGYRNKSESIRTQLSLTTLLGGLYLHPCRTQCLNAEKPICPLRELNAISVKY